MARPLDFWKMVREVNPRRIREEADRAFRAAAVGTADDITRLTLLAGLRDPIVRENAGGAWVEAATPLTPAMRRTVASCAFALALSEDAAREAPVVAWMLSESPGGRARDTMDILNRFPHLTISLPRLVPLFRPAATDRVIAATAKTNTELALVTALPGILPWTAPLLPATAFPDMVLLTKNQVMMVLRIAAIHGRAIEPQRRIAELGGVVGAAFGWRALAREIVGAVPGGIGAAAKGAIAYAGTVSVGRAAQAFYTTGQAPTPQQQRAWYRDALRRGQWAVREARERLRGGQPDPA